jgi:hypothetical protein
LYRSRGSSFEVKSSEETTARAAEPLEKGK